MEQMKDITQFDISILKENDKVLMKGIWYKLVANWRTKSLCAVDPKQSYLTQTLEDIQDKIEDYQKYIPKIRYSGANADVEAYVKDGNTLVFLELVGQESMVKAITSVLMQGKTKMNEHTVDLPAIGYYDINKGGNRRKIIDLGNGIAHAIVYHSPSIAENGFSVLVGRDDEELLAQFSQWMEKSQPLPYPKELTEAIFKHLEQESSIQFVRTFGIRAIKIDMKILDNGFADLQDVILTVCRKNGLVSPNPKRLRQKATLPTSPLLTVKQVEHIYNTISKMPKTYELDGVDIKLVGCKLFNHNMTVYIVEQDSGSDSDEFMGMQQAAFGYVENLSAPNCSEWGYVNIDEYIRKSTKGFLETKVDFSQYENQLPTYDELKEYVKNTLTYCFKNDVKNLYEEKYQGQLLSEFMGRLFEKPMTDMELYSSVMNCVRIWLLPGTKIIESDNLFDETVIDTSYGLYWEGRNGQYNKNSSKLQGHSFYKDAEFIKFLRDFFRSPVCECVSDEEALKIYIKQTLNSMLWYGQEEYDLENRIQTFKNASQFRVDLGNFIKERNIDTNGGGGGSFIDSYSYSYENQFSKPRLAIDMNKEYRLTLGREIDETLPPRYFLNDDKITVYHLEGNEFWKVAFDVLKGEPVKELSLFDFM